MLTHVQIIDALGGSTAVADICGVKSQAVSQWRRRGIPSRHFLSLFNAAKGAGLDVSLDHLFEGVPRDA
jgi:DNA-binding transcriptional regulator YdaS (Cro superfamily)